MSTPDELTLLRLSILAQRVYETIYGNRRGVAHRAREGMAIYEWLLGRGDPSPRADALALANEWEEYRATGPLPPLV